MKEPKCKHNKWLKNTIFAVRLKTKTREKRVMRNTFARFSFIQNSDQCKISPHLIDAANAHRLRLLVIRDGPLSVSKNRIENQRILIQIKKKLREGQKIIRKISAGVIG
jgi:hypothetical protein